MEKRRRKREKGKTTTRTVLGVSQVEIWGKGPTRHGVQQEKLPTWAGDCLHRNNHQWKRRGRGRSKKSTNKVGGKNSPKERRKRQSAIRKREFAKVRHVFEGGKTKGGDSKKTPRTGKKPLRGEKKTPRKPGGNKNRPWRRLKRGVPTGKRSVREKKKFGVKREQHRCPTIEEQDPLKGGLGSRKGTDRISGGGGDWGRNEGPGRPLSVRKKKRRPKREGDERGE